MAEQTLTARDFTVACLLYCAVLIFRLLEFPRVLMWVWCEAWFDHRLYLALHLGSQRNGGTILRAFQSFWGNGAASWSWRAKRTFRGRWQTRTACQSKLGERRAVRNPAKVEGHLQPRGMAALWKSSSVAYADHWIRGVEWISGEFGESTSHAIVRATCWRHRVHS